MAKSAAVAGQVRSGTITAQKSATALAALEISLAVPDITGTNPELL
jgi:hypothetical protein